MQPTYIEQHDGGYWIAATRVSLDSIVYRFWEGLSPESIAQSFPALSLEQVYGAITYYLGNKADIDAYLQNDDAEYEQFRQQVRIKNPLLSAKLDALLSNAKSRS
jgi:uncharacterized protein (DUF433 family)